MPLDDVDDYTDIYGNQFLPSVNAAFEVDNDGNRQNLNIDDIFDNDFNDEFMPMFDTDANQVQVDQHDNDSDHDEHVDQLDHQSEHHTNDGTEPIDATSCDDTSSAVGVSTRHEAIREAAGRCYDQNVESIQQQ